jgi:hypothetical protein
MKEDRAKGGQRKGNKKAQWKEVGGHIGKKSSKSRGDEKCETDEVEITARRGKILAKREIRRILQESL